MQSGFPSDFHPAIITWFERRFGEPTEPQKHGWPLINSGANTLILAPTGSGKTLAAFLAGINRVLLDLESNQAHLTRKADKGAPKILYISPLKALNYDIERNLEEPLRGIRVTAEGMGCVLPEITTFVRTGDTPPQERRRMLRRPPHILITTPESLHIMLTSSASGLLRGVQYLIVDEIHALSPNKRGVFLAILMERLENLCEKPPVRIGLSATQKPLSEVARFLGGFDRNGKPRPVEIVDTGVRREMDLKVICTADDLRHPDEGSIWPSICRQLLELVKSHKSTIIFANTRRMVERLTLGINDLAGEELVRPHHGSVSAPMRRQIENALKSGTIRGVVATGTLELGIDMGAVELVCQVESPKEVSRGLQRIGRAGHVHTAVSMGRIIPKTTADLAEAVSVAKGMIDGDVEPMSVPRNCLDVLAQQIVAIAAQGGTTWEEAYQTVRRTYSYHELTEEAFNLTLQLVSGRYPSKAFKDLRPRVSFDRVSGRISPLPGSQRLAITSGGAIPDTGEYGVYLAARGGEIEVPSRQGKIGELDEEFVYESREGDTFSLGTNNWRILKIEADRVIVTHGPPGLARMPFWRGESVPRSALVGRRMGAMLREIAERGEDAVDWIRETLPVDEKAAANLLSIVRTQMSADGAGLPTDRRIVLESFPDEIGGRRMALLSVFGARVHHALRIAMSSLIERELGVTPETISGDNGILFRLPEADVPPPFDVLRMLTPELAYELIVEDLPNTALFGLRFRQNAARALLLPGGGPGKRTPLWLQRLKAKDLLQIARRFEGFPIVVETFRECLKDYLEMDELREILRGVQSGEIQVSTLERQTPSPFSWSMLLDFQAIYQYEWDEPKRAICPGEEPGVYAGTSQSARRPMERRLIKELVDGKMGRVLDERAIKELDRMLQGIGDRYRARTAEELYELVRRIGDIPEEDAAARVVDPGLIDALIDEGRLVRIEFLGGLRPRRLAACDYLREYLGAAAGDPVCAREIIERHIASRGLIVADEIAADYGLPGEMVQDTIDAMLRSGELVEIQAAPGSTSPRYISAENLEIIYRRTLAFQKSEARPVPPQVFSKFLIQWQHLSSERRLHGQDGVRRIIRQLEGLLLPYAIWEADIIARRVEGFRLELIEDLCLSGEFLWAGQSSDTDRPGTIAFFTREGFPALYPLVFPADRKSDSTESVQEAYQAAHEAVRESLRRRGASFLIDLAMDTGLDSRVVLRILWELVWRGEATCDRFGILRSGAPPAISIRDSISHRRPRPVDRREFYRVHSRVSRTFAKPVESSPGRWTFLSSLLDGDKGEREGAESEITARHREESLQILARVLLERYGIVAKDLVRRPGEPDVIWADLYDIYQRMELSGEIERGYFVEGLAGAQFGLPEAVDELLGRTRIGSTHSDLGAKVVILNACDPAYLFSASGPFDAGFGRLNRHPSNYVVLKDGLPIVTLEMGSRALGIRKGLDGDDLKIGLAALSHLADSPWPVRSYRKVELRLEGLGECLARQARTILREAGFEGTEERMVLW